MDEQERVTIGFTIKGADPNNTLPTNAQCPTCDKLFTDHSKEEIRACAEQQRKERQDG
jgi:hypothetical protein